MLSLPQLPLISRDGRLPRIIPGSSLDWSPSRRIQDVDVFMFSACFFDAYNTKNHSLVGGFNPFEEY